jgi:hypothetical protein
MIDAVEELGVLIESKPPIAACCLAVLVTHLSRRSVSVECNVAEATIAKCVRKLKPYIRLVGSFWAHDYTSPRRACTCNIYRRSYTDIFPSFKGGLLTITHLTYKTLRNRWPIRNL